MAKTITFNELRRLKDSLPDGATHQIADKLNITVQTVRNYFGTRWRHRGSRRYHDLRHGSRYPQRAEKGLIHDGA